jgi:hypothetical protein
MDLLDIAAKVAAPATIIVGSGSYLVMSWLGRRKQARQAWADLGRRVPQRFADQYQEAFETSTDFAEVMGPILNPAEHQRDPVRELRMILRRLLTKEISRTQCRAECALVLAAHPELANCPMDPELARALGYEHKPLPPIPTGDNVVRAPPQSPEELEARIFGGLGPLDISTEPTREQPR